MFHKEGDQRIDMCRESALGQRRARGMMNGGGWRDRGEPVE